MFSTGICLSGLVTKKRFGLSVTQKARLRTRLKEVDSVVQTLVDSGVSCRALDMAKKMPKQHELSPLEKYWVASKRFKNGLKPISWVPKWTKVPHPRTWKTKYLHEPDFARGKKE